MNIGQLSGITLLTKQATPVPENNMGQDASRSFIPVAAPFRTVGREKGSVEESGAADRKSSEARLGSKRLSRNTSIVLGVLLGSVLARVPDLIGSAASSFNNRRSRRAGSV